ncbi:MAG: methyltransferase [Oscillospiraceae bacterium]|nr:methyltransferase [Oscillospiraceae bacterium]
MTVKIGNVTIKCFINPEEATYTDGPIESELYERLSKGEPEIDILLKDNRYPVLYHLSKERENVLSWLPLPPEAEVLEVGASCGALTGLLSSKCRHVVCVDVSYERSKINAVRHKNAANIEIIVDNVMSLPETPRYDIITLIGILEYAPLYVNSDSPFEELLNHLRRMLKPNGHLLIAIENQFGAKYFCGAREDHHWKVNEGLYGYPNGGARTFSYKGLDQLLYDTGYAHRQFYGMYPDYKFPQQVFSAEADEFAPMEYTYTPDCGEFQYCSAVPHKLLSECANNGLQLQLSNSFFVCAGQEPLELALYCRFATQRQERFIVTTELYNDYVIKRRGSADNKAIRNIKEGYKIISDKLPQMHLPGCEDIEGGLLFERIVGENLQQKLLVSPNRKRNEIINNYVDLIKGLGKDPDPEKFSENEDFKSVFGQIDLPPMKCAFPAPIDMSFSNLIEKDKMLFFVDTEWVFSFPLPWKYIVWRAFFLLQESTTISREELNSCCDFSEEEQQVFKALEDRFAAYVFGDRSARSYNKNYVFSIDDSSTMLTDSSVKNKELMGLLRQKEEECIVAWNQFAVREEQLEELRKAKYELEEKVRVKEQECKELTYQVKHLKEECSMAWSQFSEREKQLDELRRLRLFYKKK